MGCLQRFGGIIVSLIFVVVGGLLLIIVPGWIGDELSRIEGLPLGNAVSVNTAGIGSQLMVEGTIDTATPSIFRDYVAYERDEYRGRDSDGDANWAIDRVKTPPLLINSTGTIELIGPYDIDGSHLDWQDQGSLNWDGTSGTKRYRGLLAGRTIAAVGTVISGSEGNQFRADVVFAGTRDEYINQSRLAIIIVRVMGTVFAVLVILTGGRALLRR